MAADAGEVEPDLFFHNKIPAGESEQAADEGADGGAVEADCRKAQEIDAEETGKVYCIGDEDEPGFADGVEEVGGLVLRRDSRACVQPCTGAGRARLRISPATASADKSALCSTSPNDNAASATATRTSDGRIRLRSAAAMATLPNI